MTERVIILGHVSADKTSMTSALLAVRDALVANDVGEAYHRLRMLADPDCSVFLRTGDHWSEWERCADAEKGSDNG